MIKVSMVAGLMVAALLAGGCGAGRPTAPIPQPAPVQVNREAAERAVAFNRAHFRGENYGAAWDMALPGAFPVYKSRDEYVQRQTELLGVSPPASATVKIQQFERVEGYVYLVSDEQHQRLIWVTSTPDGWRVSRFETYRGGDIPW